MVKISWNDIKSNQSGGSGGSDANKVNYVKLDVGTNQLRIIGDEPYSRWTHWIPQANDGKGFGVDCIGKDCPICVILASDKKNKIKSKYSSRKTHAINVLTKKPGTTPEVAILDAGNKIFNGLLVLMEQMGDLKNYDVKIIKSGTTVTDTDYNVLPTFPPVMLTDTEKAMSQFTLEQIKKIFTKEQIELLISGAKLDVVFGNGIDDILPEATGTAQVDFTKPL